MQEDWTSRSFAFTIRTESVSGISLLWGYAPPDEEIHGMDPKIKAAFMLFVAGGVAGNKFSGIETIGSGATQTANLWLE
jgi:hypothetical protein